MGTYEIVKPLFYDSKKLIKQPAIIYRANFNGGRYYYSFEKDGTVLRNPSVTTILSSEMPMPKWLMDWFIKYGKEKAEEIRDRAAHYGTFFGICASNFLIDGRFDFGTLKPRIDMYKITNNIDFSTDNWEFKAKEDLLALDAFVREYEVAPIAIEIMLPSKLGFAGAVDAVVEMTIGTGMNGRILKTDRKLNKKTGEIEDKTKRIRAIIDWKSGRHGFSAANEAQLHFYKIMWNENYPHYQVDAVFNWSPKKWDDEDSSMYHLKEQSNSIERKMIMNYLENFKIRDKFGSQKFKEIDGVIEVGAENDNLKIYEFDDWVKKIHGKTTETMGQGIRDEAEGIRDEGLRNWDEGRRKLDEEIKTDISIEATEIIQLPIEPEKEEITIEDTATEIIQQSVEPEKKELENLVHNANLNTDTISKSENLINDLQMLFQPKSNGVTNE